MKFKIEAKQRPGSIIIGSVTFGRGRKPGKLSFTKTNEFFSGNENGIKPLPKEEAYPAFVKAYIETLGITQEEFSEDYGFPLATVRSWTSGRRIPSSGVIRLLYKFWVISH